ncbi:hypothetical protein NDU88_005646 [Pleurodeles waltl]|uniref:Uncharacterized protein n=1 Tax=Pleurodeles waltl TaxID=8319 RepID=A0AAV7MY58_PLEWA|nr:hypothetical protein NDU88_005646 [Pleurodeles waltl]
MRWRKAAGRKNERKYARNARILDAAWALSRKTLQDSFLKSRRDVLDPPTAPVETTLLFLLYGVASSSSAHKVRCNPEAPGGHLQQITVASGLLIAPIPTDKAESAACGTRISTFSEAKMGAAVNIEMDLHHGPPSWTSTDYKESTNRHRIKITQPHPLNCTTVTPNQTS